MKIDIPKEEIDAEEILERQIKKFGKSSHVILPQKHVGKKATIIIHFPIGAWITGYLKKYKKKN